ncbi:hypothetical protein JCM18899A_28680 [Nocardioides sp. AN3]
MPAFESEAVAAREDGDILRQVQRLAGVFGVGPQQGKATPVLVVAWGDPDADAVLGAGLLYLEEVLLAGWSGPDPEVAQVQDQRNPTGGDVGDAGTCPRSVAVPVPGECDGAHEIGSIRPWRRSSRCWASRSAETGT